MIRGETLSNKPDLIGQKFGRLTVVAEAPNYKSGKARWRCVCDCGGETITATNQLRSGRTKSCGCLRIEAATQTRKNVATHGMTGTRIYKCWSGMKGRVKRNDHYKSVTICDEWKNDFTAFYAWSIANGYSDNLTLDRIDTTGNYEPSNCRWVDYKVQENNRTNNHIIEIGGVRRTASEWSRITGIQAATLIIRHNAGWPESDMLIPPDLNNANIRRNRV